MRTVGILIAVAALGACGPRGRDGASSVEALDEAKVKAMSHAFFDAHDRADETSLARVLGTQFVSIDDGVLRRDEVLERVRGRKARGAAARTRSYAVEFAWVSDGSAVFHGRSIEHFPDDGAMVSGDFDGWYTLVWAREADAWKAVSLQYVKAGLEAERERWNAVYREGRGVPSRPNRLLVEAVRGRPPGRALDIGTGQGRNAVFLATQGWNVTGIDISDEGLRQARAAAAARGVSIEAVNADAASWDYGLARWDLAALIYMGCDEATVATLRASLKPGGLVVSERFHKDAVAAIGTEPAEFARLFADGFDILRNEVVEDVSDWGSQTVTQTLVQFVARKR